MKIVLNQIPTDNNLMEGTNAAHEASNSAQNEIRSNVFGSVFSRHE